MIDIFLGIAEGTNILLVSLTVRDPRWIAIGRTPVFVLYIVGRSRVPRCREGHVFYFLPFHADNIYVPTPKPYCLEATNRKSCAFAHFECISTDVLERISCCRNKPVGYFEIKNHAIKGIIPVTQRVYLIEARGFSVWEKKVTWAQDNTTHITSSL